MQQPRLMIALSDSANWLGYPYGFVLFALLLLFHFDLIIIYWAERKRASLEAEHKGAWLGCDQDHGSLVMEEFVLFSGGLLFILK